MDIKLLNHQYEVLSDTTTKILGMVAGYGSGKTYTACRKAIQLSYLNEGCVGIVTEPTFPMIRDILVPEMKLALEEWNVEYKFNASSSIFTLTINGKENKLICMSMENVERLVGINAAFVICDEFDTSKTDIAYKAFMKLLGRLRAGNVRQFVITTTPEGFKAAYRIFVEEIGSDRRLIKARTQDNKYLPEDFIETLKKQYPEQLLEAYLNGEFVNLTSGTVYYFNRDKHNTDLVHTDRDYLIIGQDFNVGSCCSVVYIRDGRNMYAIDEFASHDTFRIIDNIKRRYPHNNLEVIPDASGNQGQTNASKSDIQLIRDAGIKVNVPSSNPRVMDRINTTNNHFEKMNLFINVKKCPNFAKAMEQQAYDDKGVPEKLNGAGTIDDWTDAGTYPLHRLFGVDRGMATSYQGSFL